MDGHTDSENHPFLVLAKMQNNVIKQNATNVQVQDLAKKSMCTVITGA
jgi:hypothetical protein